jgi:hypothetical protein
MPIKELSMNDLGFITNDAPVSWLDNLFIFQYRFLTFLDAQIPRFLRHDWERLNSPAAMIDATVQNPRKYLTQS